MAEKQRDIIEVEAERYQLEGRLGEARDRLAILLEEARIAKVHKVAGLEVLELSVLTGIQNQRVSISMLLAESVGRLEKEDKRVQLISKIVAAISEVGVLEEQLARVSASPEPPIARLKS